VIELTINGAPHHFEHTITISELLQQLELAGKRLALERNGEIIPRGEFNSAKIANGDRLEIITAVGGG
jgi:sulfur carrier protein